MKKQDIVKVLGITLVSTAVLALNITTVTASDATTEGKVEFIPDDGTSGGDVDGPFHLIKPGTGGQEITVPKGSGKSTTGALRFGFVPNLDFGEAKVAIGETYYSAKTVAYTVNDKPDETKYIAPFLQVLDTRGSADKYEIKVKATKFQADSSTNNHTLEGTQIIIENSSFRNQTLDNIKVDSDALAGKVLDGKADKIVIGEDSVDLFNAIDADKTNVAASSMVFDKDYTVEKNYGKATLVDSIRLRVPAGDQPKVNKTYKSIITWELNSTK